MFEGRLFFVSGEGWSERRIVGFEEFGELMCFFVGVFLFFFGFWMR